MPSSFFRAFVVLTLAFASYSCSEDSAPPAIDEFGRCADFNPLRQVFWGDTHVHTELSFDANMQGTRTTQDDAYAFARGEPIALQPYDEDGTPTRMAAIDRPLDFVMLSDHAEFLGTLKVCNDPGSPGYEEQQCVDYRAAQQFDAMPEFVRDVFVRINGLLNLPSEDAAYPALCGPGSAFCLDAGTDVWRGIVNAAQAAYDRSNSCTFTAFPGYEWSGNSDGRNLHRNVMFKDENVTDLPYGYFDAPYPEELWARLVGECIDADSGCDVLTIPHNSNLSDGVYFNDRMADGGLLTPEYVELRNAMEPVIEIYQHKGASECLPGAATADELCGFEILPFSNLATTNLERITPPDPKGFLRYAYGEGMRFESSLGTNPFQYGITAATDTHISAPGFVAENDFKGHGGAGQPNRFLPPPPGFPDVEYLSPGGLTAVWAEENARDAIFSALRRKETFGTSGPRMTVRMFGGWDYPSDLCDSAELVAQADAAGVPMGGTLDPQPASSAPVFVVSAMQDSTSAPLQRAQIVKGWLDGDDYQVRVFEIAGDPNNGASVNLDTCAREGEGFGDLCGVWQDPDFDPAQRAYYYARVLENPSCRWTTWQCSAAQYECNDWDYAACVARKDELPPSDFSCDCCDPATGLRPAFCAEVDCSDPGLLAEAEERCCHQVEPTIQERAWTSPIWYQPPS
ncbi:MAG: DUF3604 domain-containing protein [Deltaproteobacteria bacterium]|nr:DUF3604 domain-containing protein [Deltaproteobacteria bacterium]NND28785.1 DUF3604 domain-containing protein [Myxococcales bacterium]MBT8466764.1 DUF3604 domain-containing protein [Deltaproteobacteria bacterium]MBT8481201.1 DUF3604 domain-containing protein [Deltaproteobacteria bacterium]NNK07341.1 DUF3604 domain-containing protein [Myxococcales bacterium]